MTLESAVRLIAPGMVTPAQPQQWYDLGAGDGLFSQALAKHLPEGSEIISVDKRYKTMTVVSTSQPIAMHRVPSDFTQFSWLRKSPHGVLMANALHFVPAAPDFILELRKRINRPFRFILIEYDVAGSSPWLPYPVPFDAAARVLGVQRADVIPLGRLPSRYHAQGIYAVAVDFDGAGT